MRLVAGEVAGTRRFLFWWMVGGIHPPCKWFIVLRLGCSFSGFVVGYSVHAVYGETYPSGLSGLKGGGLRPPSLYVGPMALGCQMR
jgi:hypothetical protein